MVCLPVRLVSKVCRISNIQNSYTKTKLILYQAQSWNQLPTYQQGNQVPLGQFAYNYYQPGVPLPTNIQQSGAQAVYQQTGQLPYNYPFGISRPINIGQLSQAGPTSGLNNIPTGTYQQAGQPQAISFGTLQQVASPLNQQYTPLNQQYTQPGPITFPQ